MVNNLPAIVQEMRVQSLCRKDPLEEEMATHPSVLAWEGILACPMDRGACRATVYGVTKESDMT